LIQKLDELMNPMQCMILGKLPMNLSNPTTLNNILRNVPLYLPGVMKKLLELELKISICITNQLRWL